MALSADEQRALAEIERRLVTDDPGLATCLTAFRRPGPARVLRSPRARIVGSLFTVLLVAMVSLMVYAMIPFRTQGATCARHSERGYHRQRIDRGHRDGRPAAQQPARFGQREHEHDWYRLVCGQVRGTLGRSERGYRPGQADRESGGGPGRVAGHRPVAAGTAVTAAGRRGRRTDAR